MAIERTLSIIKPDAVAKNVIGEIYSRFEKAGLRIVGARMEHLSTDKAGEFYAVHKERPFYQDLVDFMTSGPVMIQVLEGENAIAKNREVIPTPPTPPPAPSAPISRKPSTKTPCTVPMVPIPRKRRSSSFSAATASVPAPARTPQPTARFAPG